MIEDIPKEIALLHAFAEGFKLSFETGDEYLKTNERLGEKRDNHLFYCLKCKFISEINIIMKPSCPNCKEHLQLIGGTIEELEKLTKDDEEYKNRIN
jgi:uncharacterized paraquat-inducible protein A